MNSHSGFAGNHDKTANSNVNWQKNEPAVLHPYNGALSNKKNQLPRCPRMQWMILEQSKLQGQKIDQ